MGSVSPPSAKAAPGRRYKRKAGTRAVLYDGDNNYYGSVPIYGLEPPEVEKRLVRMRRVNGSVNGTNSADGPPG